MSEEYSSALFPCTPLKIPDNHAIRYIAPADLDSHPSLRDPRGDWLNNKRIPSWLAQRRWGVQLVGAVSADPIEFTAAWCGLFKEAGVPPKRKISRFLVSPDAALKPGACVFFNCHPHHHSMSICYLNKAFIRLPRLLHGATRIAALCDAFIVDVNVVVVKSVFGMKRYGRHSWLLCFATMLICRDFQSVMG